MTKLSTVELTFQGYDPKKDDKAIKIAEKFGGELLGTGVWINGPHSDLRDMEFAFPTTKAKAAAEALKEAGFKVEAPRPYKDD